MNYAILDHLIDDEKKIRTDVFIKEQGFRHEFDETDEYSTHLLVYDGDIPVGCGRVYEVFEDIKDSKIPFFSVAESPVYAIGRIALISDYRGMKLGSSIVWKLVKLAESYGAKTIQLSAQCRVQKFYETCGFTVASDIYMDEDCPHVLMRKSV